MSDPVQIAFIGAGNMATALIHGMLQAGIASPESLRASDLRQEALDALREELGIQVSKDNAVCVADAEAIVLCVKPQILPALLPELSKSLPADALVISVAAGVPCAVLESLLPPGARVVRVMPNTPALVQAGATGIAPGSHATPQDLDLSERIFASVGATVTVDEPLIDAVTGVSGSGPAYVFRFAEALAKAGEDNGLTPADALKLAKQTLFGAAKLLMESDEAPSLLRTRVTSKGGTTAAGLDALEEAGFPDAIHKCVRSAAARGRSLGEEAKASASSAKK